MHFLPRIFRSAIADLRIRRANRRHVRKLRLLQAQEMTAEVKHAAIERENRRHARAVESFIDGA